MKAEMPCNQICHRPMQRCQFEALSPVL